MRGDIVKPARVVNGEIVARPYALRPTAKQAHPEVSPLPGTWEQCTPEQLAALECVWMQDVARPELQAGESCAEGAPELVGGEWRQTWIVTPAPSDAYIRADLVSEIKQLARAHILASLPDWKQTNMAARAIELTRIQMSGADLSPTEAGELAWLESAWAWVKAVRGASDLAEAALPGMTRAQLDNWTEPTWPVFGA